MRRAPLPARYVFWYHNERMINYDSERGISVTTTPGRRTHSQLFIQRAEVSDSGNYTCAPSSSLPASISVFVSGKLEPHLGLTLNVELGSVLVQALDLIVKSTSPDVESRPLYQQTEMIFVSSSLFRVPMGWNLAWNEGSHF